MIPLSFTLDLGSPNFQIEFRRFIKFFTNEELENDYSHDPYKKQILKNMDHFKKRKPFFSGKNLWLIKPAGKNRGQGIFVFNSLDKLNEFLNSSGKKEPLPYKISNSNQFAQKNIAALLRYKENLIQKFIIKMSIKKTYSRRFVIQKYLEMPLLINKRKFDIRVWVLLDHKKNFYLFKFDFV